MKEIINLVCNIYHVKKADIISLATTASGLAILSYSAKQEIPISKSATRLAISSTRSGAGRSYDVSLSANLKQEITDLTPGVYLVRLSGGDTYLIGTKDYPVFYNSDEALTEKSFSIKYKSVEKPFKISS